jgi:hypothetical protein
MESSSPSERKSLECDEVERHSFRGKFPLCFSSVACLVRIETSGGTRGRRDLLPHAKKNDLRIYERRVAE